MKNIQLHLFLLFDIIGPGRFVPFEDLEKTAFQQFRIVMVLGPIRAMTLFRRNFLFCQKHASLKFEILGEGQGGIEAIRELQIMAELDAINC